MPVGHTDSPATPSPDELGRGGAALEQVAAYLRALVDRDLPGLVAKNVELFDLLRKAEDRGAHAHQAWLAAKESAGRLKFERDEAIEHGASGRGRAALWAFALGVVVGMALTAFLTVPALR
jgi:hypothetical protein